MENIQNNSEINSHRGLGMSLCMYLFWSRWPVLQRRTESDMSEQSRTDGSGLLIPRMIHDETCCKTNQELKKKTKRSPQDPEVELPDPPPTPGSQPQRKSPQGSVRSNCLFLSVKGATQVSPLICQTGGSEVERQATEHHRMREVQQCENCLWQQQTKAVQVDFTPCRLGLSEETTQSKLWTGMDTMGCLMSPGSHRKGSKK